MQHEACKVENPLPEHLCGLLDCHARDIGLPGAIGSGIIGGDVSILFAYHVDLVHGQTDSLGCHHGKDGVGSLADFRRSHLQLQGPVLVKHHAASRSLQCYRVDTCLIAENTHADAFSYRPCLVGIEGAFLCIVEVFLPNVDTFGESVRMAFNCGYWIDKAKFHHVLFSEYDRVKTCLPYNVIDVRLKGKCNLRDPISSHGSCCGQVCIDCIGFAFDRPNGVHHTKTVDRIGNEGVSMRCIGTLVGVGDDGPCCKGAVLTDVGYDMEFHGMTNASARKCLFPSVLQTDLPSSYPSGEVCVQRLGQGILTVTKSPSEIWLDDPDVTITDPKGLRADTSDKMGDLGCSDHYYLSIFHVGKGGGFLNMTVLDNGGIVVAFDLDKALFLDGLVKGSHFIGGADYHVVRPFFVDGHGARGQGFIDREYGLILVVDDLNLSGSLMCSDFIFCYDSGNIVAVETNTRIEEFPVSNVLMFLYSGPRVPCSGELNIRHVKTGDNIDDTGDLPSLFQVKRQDKAICDGAV